MSTKNESLLILRSQHNLWLPIDLQRPWKEGPMARLASWLLLIKLLWWSKWFIGWLILGTLGLIAICNTAALQTSIQTHNVIQNWTKDAHTMWTTQAQINEEVQGEIQEIKIALQWVGDQLIDLQKQAILKCDWNSTQFCINPLRFNYSAYNWKQIKFHLQYLHDNASLNVQLLQKEIFETFSKSLPSSNNLETLAEQLADQLSGLDPRGWFQRITCSVGSGTIMLISILVIIFVVYWCFSTKIVQTKQTQLVRAFFTKLSTVTPIVEKKGGGLVRGIVKGSNMSLFSFLCHFSRILYALSVPGKEEQAELHAVLGTDHEKGHLLGFLSGLPWVTPFSDLT